MKKSRLYVKKSGLKTKIGSKKNVSGKLPKIFWFIYPVIFILFIQSLAYGSLAKGFVNTLVNPYYFFLTYILTIGFSFILWLFFENRWVSFTILNILGFILALGNRFTIPSGETGLALNNISIFKELNLIENANTSNFIPFIIMLLFFIPILYFIIYLMYPWKHGLKYRKLVAVGSFLVFLIFSQIIVPFISTPKNELSNVNKLGVILFFNNGVFNRENIKYPDESQVNEIMEQVDVKQNQPITKPNIIMVQLTNFVDISRIMDVENDPLINYHNSFNEASKYIVDVSAEDSISLNVEFEVLAGLPIEFHPNELQVRASNTTDGTISLGGILAKQNYRSVSILPYPEGERTEFYKKLSFDQYISSEDSEIGITKNIIEKTKTELEKAVENNKPVFIYTHFNMLKKSYEDNDINQYLNDLKLLDDQIGLLRDTIAASKEPMILMFYSDNLPDLGTDNKIYYDSGYLKNSDLSLEIKGKLNAGDMMLWNNYNQGYNYQSGEVFDLSSIPFLLLSEGDFSMPNYLHYFKYLKDEKGLSKISANYIELNKVLFSNNTNEYKELSKEFGIVVKDVLGPYKYVEGDLKLWSK